MSQFLVPHLNTRMALQIRLFYTKKICFDMVQFIELVQHFNGVL
jgi:hypothetical protein